tara:strand:+ start:4567 stop:4908 length:342 start_codon:yes stop_codon:yes gene_type:complete
LDRKQKSIIDKYVELRRSLDELRLQEKILRVPVEKLFKDSGLKELTGTNNNKVKRIVSSIFTVNPGLFFKRVKVKDFLKCCRLSVGTCADYMSRSDVLKISHKAEKVSLKINP